MTGKLVRNTSDPRWRDYWKAVDAAASKAPALSLKKENVREPTQSSPPKPPASRK